MGLTPSIRPASHGVVRTALVSLGGATLVTVLVAAVVLVHPGSPAAPVMKVIVTPAPVIVPIHVPAVIAPVFDPVPDPVPPRATSPFLTARCVDQRAQDDEADPICSWDDGFPAISRDGKTIVQKRIPEDFTRGYPGLYLDLVDVATSRRRSLRILDPNEYDPEGGKHRTKIEPRVAAATRVLEAGDFRTIQKLAQLHDGEPTPLVFEVEGDSIRILETATSSSIDHATYPARAAYPNLRRGPDDMCGTADTGDMRAWWDAETRTLVTDVDYVFGPSCHCGGETKTYVRRVRR